MVLITNGQKTLALTASIIGFVQAVIWFGLSLTCILEYSIAEPPETDNSSSTVAQFNYRVYHLYLDKDEDPPANTIVSPTAFLVFNSVYIILTSAWCVISIFQFQVVRKRGINTPISFKDWAIVAWLVSFEDLIFEIFLGIDYSDSCLKYYKDPLSELTEEEVCVDTVIPVLVIVARGFVLWLVNVIIAILLYINAKRIRNREGSLYKGTFGGIFPVLNYQKSIPRVKIDAAPSLFNQQLETVNTKSNYWSVNLRTAMDNRTPPTSPVSPLSSTPTSPRSVSPVSPGRQHMGPASPGRQYMGPVSPGRQYMGPISPGRHQDYHQQVGPGRQQKFFPH